MSKYDRTPGNSGKKNTYKDGANPKNNKQNDKQGSKEKTKKDYKPTAGSKSRGKPSDRFSDKPSYKSKRKSDDRFDNVRSDNWFSDDKPSEKPRRKQSDRVNRSDRFSDRQSSDKFKDTPYDRFEDKPSYKSNRRSGDRFSEERSDSWSDRPKYKSDDRSTSKSGYSKPGYAKSGNKSRGSMSDRSDRFADQEYGDRFGDKYNDRFEGKPSYKSNRRSGERFSEERSGSWSDRPKYKSDDRSSSKASYKTNRRSDERFNEESFGGFDDNLTDTPRRKYNKPGDSYNRRPSSRFGEKTGEKSYGKLGGERRGPRPGDKPAGFRRSGPSRPKRGAREFNPLSFIKRVEDMAASPVYVPKNMFSDFQIQDQIKENIIGRGYQTPTPIQDIAIPLILEGKDIVATANTGTGKTAAFLIPLINNVLTKKINKVLIITPTRELADQIKSELGFFKARTGLHAALCIGGLSINLQIENLKKDPTFVIGTPGRLIDLEQNKSISFSRFDAIVLDEVDTMLDMGFVNDIKYIVNKLPKKRHSLFFSATIPASLKDVMDSFLDNPVSVSVKTRQSAENVNQDIVKVTSHNKLDVLHDLLIKPEFKKVIIFSRTKRATDKLSKMLRERGFEVMSIHGDKTQAQRKKALTLFKDNKVKILLATDVVSRGIDIDDVSHVINFDLPQTYEDYIHRIGRTGRANKIGQAITFVE